MHSGCVKTATHRTHDEADYSSNAQHRTKATDYLIEIANDMDSDKMKLGTPIIDDPIHVEHTHQHAAAALLQATPQYPIGTPIEKEFDGDMYHGTVIDYDEDEGYYKIQYDDGDEEEMDMEDVKQYTNDKHRPILNNDPKHTHKDILQLELTLDIFGPSTTIKIPITQHEQLGFEFHEGKCTPTILNCKPRTPANTIRMWRSRF